MSNITDIREPLNIVLVGVGGTGLTVLKNLARIHYANINTGKTPLFVTAYDSKTIEEHNLGRQLFSRHDLGNNKAVTAIEMINRFYGFNWIGRPQQWLDYENQTKLIVSCVDSVKARKQILKKSRYNNRLYWVDFGNNRYQGQVVLGNFITNDDEIEEQQKLPHVFDIYPDMQKYEDSTEPSCSMFESLIRQDLFVNSMLAEAGSVIIRNLINEKEIGYHGLYLNTKTMQMQPLPC